jgi:OOP family OmpA-OmpF porin
MKLRLYAVIVLACCLGVSLSALVRADAMTPSRPEACACFGPAAMRDGDGDGVPDRIDRCVNTLQGCTVDAWGCPLDADADGVCDGLDKCLNTAKGEQVDASGCSANQRTLNAQRQPPAQAPQPKQIAPPVADSPKPDAQVSEMERQLVEGGRIRLENVYFETNSANLLPESEATLNEAGRTLEKFPNLRIEVQGHTDTRGSAAHNLRLSQARSESVRRYLLEHFQLGADRYVANGYGETQPETQERNDEELLRNRRVVLSVLNPEDLPHGVRVENKP